MIITTTGLITGKLLHDIDAIPYVLEDSGGLAVKIHFEPEETCRIYQPACDKPDNMAECCF